MVPYLETASELTIIQDDCGRKDDPYGNCPHQYHTTARRNSLTDYSSAKLMSLFTFVLRQAGRYFHLFSQAMQLVLC